MADQQTLGDGRFASTKQNRDAGRALRLARRATGGPKGSTQAEFASILSISLGTEVSAAALSNWESGRRGVPAAVLIEAVAAADQSTDALLAKAGEPNAIRRLRTAQRPEGDGTALTAEIESLRRQVEQLTEVAAAVPDLQRAVATQNRAIKRLLKQQATREPQLGGS